MKVRILSAIVMAIVGVPVLIFADTIIYPIVAGLLSLCSTWEVLRVLGASKKYTIAIPSYIVSLFFFTVIPAHGPGLSLESCNCNFSLAKGEIALFWEEAGLGFCQGA